MRMHLLVSVRKCNRPLWVSYGKEALHRGMSDDARLLCTADPNETVQLVLNVQCN